MRRAALLLALGAAACEPMPEPPPNVPAQPQETAAPAPPPPAAPPVEVPAKFEGIPRLQFNTLAATLDLPLFWIADADSDGKIDPAELAVLWGGARQGAPFVENGRFTPAFKAAFEAMLKVKNEGYLGPGLSEAEKTRRAAVLAELAQGRPSLVRTDLKGASAEDRALVQHVLEMARIVDHIYEEQLGTAGLDAGIPGDDPASRSMFRRNHGPFCEAPKTENDPHCTALPAKPPRVSGLYPASVQKEPKFCEKLEARKDQKALLGPFTAVVEKNGDLVALPYTAVYKDEMAAVSRELAAAAEAVKSAEEAPLKAYLQAASRSFLDNDWQPADEAWSKMGVHNSRWYLRVGPDETGGDPCSRKAGFHVSFARINQDSIAWQKRLEPVKNDMEGALAKMAGAPYKARKVSFHLPDFIDIVVNAGDSRNALGATIGQSLPNWGPVANEGRGRTVAMTNLYTDPDSRAIQRESAEGVLCKTSLDVAALDPALSTMATVLHEAAHNLGPAAEYKVKGKTDAESFGGSLAAMLEELKAQTSALYLTDWLAGKGLISAEQARLGHVSDIVWAFGHIAQGMYSGDGTPKPYSQLASIEVGSFLKAGAMAFHADEMAANGKDKGCFAIVPAKLPAAIAALEKRVLEIKGKADKAAAVKLKSEFVDADGEWKKLRAVIAERWLRQPKASFVYAVEM
jgi:hypothetical protein